MSEGNQRRHQSTDRLSAFGGSSDDRDYLIRTYPDRWVPQTQAAILATASDHCATAEEWESLLDDVDRVMRLVF